MEKELAILFADLSGYTAMTETHGAETAANIIDEYLSIVNQSISETVKIHQNVGDEVLLVSDNAEDLFHSAVLLRTNCYGKADFPSTSRRNAFWQLVVEK